MNAADTVSRLLRRVNFAGMSHPMGMQETEAFRADEGVKASRIQDLDTVIFARLIQTFTTTLFLPFCFAW